MLLIRQCCMSRKLHEKASKNAQQLTMGPVLAATCIVKLYIPSVRHLYSSATVCTSILIKANKF